MDCEFIGKFNNSRQYVRVVIGDVSPDAVQRKGGGRWAYFLPTWESPRRGEFGEIHIVKTRVRHDVVAHELLHLLAAWLRAKDMVITVRNEERLCGIFDQLVFRFWREYEKL